ncbi:MAG: 4-demethylwyosine synthase TYW1 [Archaeoglobaceae archaeon]
MKQLSDLKGYYVFNHSAVKTCLWLKKSLKDGGVCYKEKFYRIHSHRCLQMTPALLCNQFCIHCWRPLELLRDFKAWDKPEEIVEESIKAQKKLLSGFYGTEGVNKRKLEEAQNPKHVAISLIGEPTLYPYLPELIDCYKERGFTTFLVTNGTNPEMVERVKPTQLYISLTAFNEESHVALNRPLRNYWPQILKSLEAMRRNEARKVLRLTLIKGINMNEKAIESFDKLIRLAEPDYVEAKAYMFLGYSRLRLKYENMPSHEEIVEFSKILSRKGYEIVNESESSRVCLLRV